MRGHWDRAPGHTRRDLLRLAAAAGAGAALAGPLARSAFAAPTASYDDGTPDVPGGLAGDPERVIIVGAGWAGLTVANALRNAGVDHVLLEGRSRIGGRAYTADLGGAPVDLGCSWIHGPIGNPMTAYAEQAGIGRTAANPELDAAIIRLFDAHLDREVALTDKLAALALGANFAQNDSATIADELGPRASVRDGAELYLDRQGLQGDARRQTAFVIRLLSEFVYGDSWERLSLHYWSWGKSESTYQGLGQGDFPNGGYRNLIQAMAGGGEVRLRHRVHAIERRRGGVVVRASTAGRRVAVRGSHVVVAVPLGVLKHGTIRFAPRLPMGHQTAISKIGFGAVEKVAMIFDEPFWSDATHTHALYISDPAPLEQPYFVDLNRINGVPGLVAFSGGGFARQLHHGPSKKEAVAFTVGRLREMMGREVPQPHSWAVTDWGGDPYSRGSYSHVLAGRTNGDLDTLASPVAGRILFAGEATNRIRHSTADGALSSGIREAKRLLRRPAVTLSAG